MRSAVLMLSGLALVGVGVAVLVSDSSARWWLGPGLLLLGLLVKGCGFLLSDDPTRARAGSRTVTTLDGQAVESPRPGVPAARTNVALRRAS